MNAGYLPKRPMERWIGDVVEAEIPSAKLTDVEQAYCRHACELFRCQAEEYPVLGSMVDSSGVGYRFGDAANEPEPLFRRLPCIPQWKAGLSGFHCMPELEDFAEFQNNRFEHLSLRVSQHLFLFSLQVRWS